MTIESDRIAVVDIGTNSVKLLIARAHKTRRFEIDHFARQTARIQTGASRRAGSVDTNLDVLSDFKDIIRGFDCRHVFAFGTHGLRELSKTRSGRSVVRAFERSLGAPIRILSGTDEARFAYESARHNLPLRRRLTVLIDIGGGSTELVAADRGGVRHARSLSLGALGLTERFIHSDPIDKTQFKTLAGHVDRVWRRTLASTGLADESPRAIDLVASGGTIGSLSLVIAGRTTWPKTRFGKSPLPPPVRLGDVRSFLDRCLALPLSDRKRIKGLEPERADIICAGLAIALSVMRHLNKRVLRPNQGGVREGVLIHALKSALRSGFGW